MAGLDQKKAKRSADNYLTDQNWDNEDEEPTEPGSYKNAPDDILSSRVFKKAKRRIAKDSDGVKTASPFALFGGFGSPAPTIQSTPAAIGKAASEVQAIAADPKEAGSKEAALQKEDGALGTKFWSKSTNTDFFSARGQQPVQSGTAESKNSLAEAGSMVPASLGSSTLAVATSNRLVAAGQEARCGSLQASNEEGKEDTYFQKLAGLNVSVLSWIRQHVEKNPIIDLTPVFRDYEQYMKELDCKYSTDKKADTTRSSTSSVPIALSKTQESTASSSSSSAISQMKLPSIFSSTPIAGSALHSSQAPKFAPALTSPFSFAPTANLAKPSNLEDVKENDDEDEVPPVPERKLIVEEDAFYTVRCKLFYKKGSQYQDLGVGMLYLKPQGDKTQLLVRMETTTGKILLNVCLSSSIPMARVGSNNVSLVTKPNPPVFTKSADGDNSLPLTYLIRVKGATEADELLRKLKDSSL